jgi:hypothetical protein
MDEEMASIHNQISLRVCNLEFDEKVTQRETFSV